MHSWDLPKNGDVLGLVQRDWACQALWNFDHSSERIRLGSWDCLKSCFIPGPFILRMFYFEQLHLHWWLQPSCLCNSPKYITQLRSQAFTLNTSTSRYIIFPSPSQPQPIPLSFSALVNGTWELSITSPSSLIVPSCPLSLTVVDSDIQESRHSVPASESCGVCPTSLRIWR